MCPVKTYEDYIEKLNNKNKFLWQAPRTKWEEDDTVWYQAKKRGKDKLGNMIAEITVAAKLSRRYTNHCVRASCVTTLDDFDVSVDGTEVLWTDPTSLTSGTQLVTNQAGTYTLSEGAVSGYTNGTFSCSGAADLDPSDGITVALGENVVCTVTNTDDVSGLTVTKVITSDNGGTATVADVPQEDCSLIFKGGPPARNMIRGGQTLSCNFPSGQAVCK